MQSVRGTFAQLACVCIVALLSGVAHGQVTSGITLSIQKHARLTSAGIVVFSMQIVCGPFEGFEDFQEALAGASQQKTGAGAEGGIDGTVVCDGVERTHTAHLSPYTVEEFKRGPAGVSAWMFVCMLLGDEQQCYQGGMSRQVILRGGAGS